MYEKHILGTSAQVDPRYQEAGVSMKAQIKQESGMDRAFGEAFQSLNRAELNFERLRDHLKPVTSSQESVCGESGRPSPPPNCEFEERLLQLAHRISCLSDGIAATQEKLCI